MSPLCQWSVFIEKFVLFFLRGADELPLSPVRRRVSFPPKQHTKHIHSLTHTHKLTLSFTQTQTQIHTHPHTHVHIHTTLQDISVLPLPI